MPLSLEKPSWELSIGDAHIQWQIFIKYCDIRYSVDARRINLEKEGKVAVASPHVYGTRV